MRTITLDKKMAALVAAGIPREKIQPCDTQVSLVTSKWVRDVFTKFVFDELKRDGLLPMRKDIFDCEDVAMAVRYLAVKLHRRDPRDSVVEDPAGVNATGIAVGVVITPGHSFNVIITSDAPDEVTVRFFDFTLEGKEIPATDERIPKCKLVII